MKFDLYYCIYWPEWQELTKYPDFEEHSSIGSNDSDICGPYYFVEKEWFDNLKI